MSIVYVGHHLSLPPMNLNLNVVGYCTVRDRSNTKYPVIVGRTFKLFKLAPFSFSSSSVPSQLPHQSFPSLTYIAEQPLPSPPLNLVFCLSIGCE